MQSHPGLDGRKVLILVSEDDYFLSHRLPIARALRDAGCTVFVACSMSQWSDRIRAEGFEPVHVPFDRAGTNPLNDLRTLRAIIAVYRRTRPDIVHHVAIKPVLYGSIAARITGVPKVINALAGLGFLFIGGGAKRRFMRWFFSIALRAVGNRANTRIVVQNADDEAIFRALGFDAARIIQIPGSGVDTDAFPATASPSTSPVIAVCVSRMLWDKGIGELVEAAHILKHRQIDIRIRLVGGTDANPASVSKEKLAAWRKEGVVDVVGPSNAIAEEYAQAHIAVLPSYREGLPKSLLEAASCARPIVSTDVPGCREICRHGENGLLVPARDPMALADALTHLAMDADLSRRFGLAGRDLIERRFSQNIIVEKTLSAYKALLVAPNHGSTEAQD